MFVSLHVWQRELARSELAEESGQYLLAYRKMANTISNMKMTNPLKGLVSKRRKRYMQDGFNLDLSCILLPNLSKPMYFKRLNLNLTHRGTSISMLVVVTWDSFAHQEFNDMNHYTVHKIW